MAMTMSSPSVLNMSFFRVFLHFPLYFTFKLIVPLFILFIFILPASAPSTSLLKKSSTGYSLYHSSSYTTLSDISDYAQNLFDIGLDELVRSPEVHSKTVSLENQIFLQAWCKMIKHIIKYANKIQSASLRTVLPR